MPNFAAISLSCDIRNLLMVTPKQLQSSNFANLANRAVAFFAAKFEEISFLLGSSCFEEMALPAPIPRV
jgi:hypothetical protein